MGRLAVLLAISTFALVGCTVDAPPDDPGQTLAPPPTATPTFAPDGDDTLFTVTATAVDEEGDEAQLQLVGREPQASDAVGREGLRDEFIAQCAALDDPSLTADGLRETGSTLMVIEVTATGVVDDAIDLRLGGATSRQVATGGVAKDSSGCFSGWQLVSAGSATAITGYETGTGAIDVAQWMLGGYGFEAAVGSTTTFTDCVLTLTDRARAAGVEGVTGWSAADAVGDHGCWFGYAGD